MRPRVFSYLPLILAGVAGLLLVVSQGSAPAAWVSASLTLVAGALAGWQAYRRRQDAQARAYLRDRWGKEDTRDRDFEAIEDRYLAYAGPETGPDSAVLDGASWQDLDMDAVFARLDRTHTNPGELMLYTMLRRPLPDPAARERRRRTIELLQSNPQLRDALLFCLHKLGRARQANLAALLGEELVPIGRPWLYHLLAWLAWLSLLSPLLLGSHALLYIVLPVFAVNGWVAFAITRDDVLTLISTLRLLGGTVATACRITDIPGIDAIPEVPTLRQHARATARISRKIRALNPEAAFSTEVPALLAHYYSAFFLWEIRTFNRVVLDIRRHRAELRELVRLVGELDALQSVASFRADLPHYCEPEFVQGTALLEIRDGRHPLVASPVDNSIACGDHGLFVTGSNMAGKSTFLRMVALNVLLAQTIDTCCAGAYRATLFRITSSICHVDEVYEGTSYFMAEAQRLLHVIRCAEDGGVPYLCLIDEMLRGTNSAERHAASLAVLRHLAGTRALVVAASHDTELGRMLEDRYRLYHFSESVNRERLEFDYRLRPGTCAAGNALRVIEWLGFPATAVADARAHLARLQARGGAYLAPDAPARLPAADGPVDPFRPRK